MSFILLVYVAGALVWSSPPLDSLSQCRALLSDMSEGFDPDALGPNDVDMFTVEAVCRQVAEKVSA